MTALETTQRMPFWLARLLRVTLFAALTAVGARITFELPFTPVPITLQVLFVIAAGLALGSLEGAGSQLAYLGALLAGLPLDARGLGATALVGPTAGYLWAFPAAAAVAGLGARGPFRLVRRTGAGLVGLAVIYVSGVSVLAIVTEMAWPAAWTLGAAPFVLVDAGKVLLAASGTSAIEGLWANLGSSNFNE